jgi:LPXTG-site transpeptidase (sortase) family protein
MKKSDKNIYHIGNALIFLSIICFMYIFYPLMHAYISPAKSPTEYKKNVAYLSIPKIKAYAQVKENVDPFNENVYKEALKEGVAHAKGTSLPGDDGTVYIFAHSSGAPWEITRLNTIFLRLSELEKGDIIEIKKNKESYRYRVTQKKEVMPTEVEHLLNTGKTQLILQTCTPIGTDWKRLLVFAEPY